MPDDGSLTVARMPLAPTWLTCISLAAYVYLGVQGSRFLFISDANMISLESKTELRQTLLIMCTLYLLEFTAAAVWNRTTMFGWDISTFLLHHLPFALVVGGAMLLDVDYEILNGFRWTLTLDLMTGFNEGIHAGKTLGLFPRWIELPRCLYVISIIVPLVFIESSEAWNVLSGDAAIQSKIVAALTLPAPVYHVLDVIPCSVKGVKKTWKRLTAPSEKSS